MLCVIIRGDSNEHTQHTIISIKKHPKLSKIQSCLKPWDVFFLGTKERVRNSHGLTAISVRATGFKVVDFLYAC